MPGEFAVEVWRPDGGKRIRYRPVDDGQGWWRVEERRAHGQWQVESRERVVHVELVSDPDSEFSDFPVDIPSAEAVADAGAGGDGDFDGEGDDADGTGPAARDISDPNPPHEDGTD